MKKILGLSVVLALLGLAPVAADDFGAVLSGNGEGVAGFRTDNGTLSYWIIVGGAGTPTGATVGGTDLNAAFDGAGYATGTIAFAGDIDGANVVLQGVGVNGTAARTATGNGNPDPDPDPDPGDDPQRIDTGDTSVCVSGPNTACLVDGRFEVEVTFDARNDEAGDLPAGAVELTDDTAYFTFFDAGNVEVVTKVLNGCGFNENWWVFTFGGTDVEVNIQTRDTTNGFAWVQSNAQRNFFEPQFDTDALPTCP